MIKTLAKSIRQYWKATVATPFLMIFEVAVEIVIPLLMANLIDFGIDMGNLTSVVNYGLLLLLCALLQMASGMFAGRTAAVAAAGFATNLREDMFSHVQTFSFANIDHFSPSSIVTRLTTDVSNVQMAFQMMLRMVFRAPLMMIFALIVSFRISPSISMIFLICIPVLGVALAIIMKLAFPIFNRVFKHYDHLNRTVEENVRGMRVVKSFTREDHEIKKFGAVSEKIYKDFTKAEKLVVTNMPLMQLCVYACMLLISWFGARTIVASGNNPAVGLTTGQLMSLITYTMQILMSLMMISMIFVMLTISRSSAQRIGELLSEKSDLTSPENADTLIPDGSVRFEDVSFVYASKSETKVLTDINLSVASGESIGILGVTGSSKSSLVSLIPRLYDATEGKVLVGGKDVRTYDLDALRHAVSMVLQKNELFSGTVRENLRWGNENATDEDLREACRIAQADSFVSAMPDGYDTHIEQGGANVSGGQKQRLCIARAIVARPKVLIFDDSTSAVDTRTDLEIRDALKAALPDTTKFIIAQRVSSVMHCDRILVLEEGRIAACGTHEALLESSPAYRETYLSQQKGGKEDE